MTQHDNFTRRGFLGAGLVAGAATITACGSRDDAGSGGGSGGSPGSGAGATGNTRTVTVQGTSYRIPTRPRRVVCLHNACLMPVIDVDGAVYACSEVPLTAVPPQYQAKVKKIKPINGKGSDQAVTAEQVLAQNPDLILAYDRMEPAVLAEMKKIAPTVVIKIDGRFRTRWEERVKGAAAIYDKNATYTDLQKKFEAHAARIKTTYAAQLKKAKIVAMGSFDPQNFAAYGPDSMIGDVYSRAGATFVPVVQNGANLENPGEFEDSMENVDKYVKDADILFIASAYGGRYDPTNVALADKPAVKARKDLIVQPCGPITISNYAQVDYMLDQLETALKKVK